MANLVNDIDAIDELNAPAPTLNAIDDDIELTGDLPRTAAIVADEKADTVRALLLAHNERGAVVNVASLALKNGLKVGGLRARLSSAIRERGMVIFKAGKGTTNVLYVGRGTVAYVAPTE